MFKEFLDFILDKDTSNQTNNLRKNNGEHISNLFASIPDIKNNQYVKTIIDDYKYPTSEGINYKQYKYIPIVFLQDLIKDLQTNNSNYVTYFNEAVLSGNTPDKVLVLDKNLFTIKDNPVEALSEVYASRLLNAIGLPTAYTMLVTGDDLQKTNKLNIDNKERPYHILSTNFLPDDKKFYTLSKCGTHFGTYSSPKDILTSLDELIYNYYTSYHNVYEDKNVRNMNQLFSDNAKRLLFDNLTRIHVLADEDFNSCNCGVIENIQDRTISIAPNFDMEHCFMKSQDTNGMYNTMESINRAWPNDLKHYVDKIKELNKINDQGISQAQQIIRKETNNDSKLTQEVEYLVRRNMSDLTDCYDHEFATSKDF